MPFDAESVNLVGVTLPFFLQDFRGRPHFKSDFLKNNFVSFFRKEQAPSFISTPSSPLYPVENDNITLQWTYTLDGSPLDQVEVIFTSDSPSLPTQRVARYRSGGTTQVASNFRDRFVFSLTDSQSTMTILRSQRSDSGTYELTVFPDDFAATTIKDSVKISVKCKYNVFPYFLLWTSSIIIRSDSGTYELTLSPDDVNLALIEDEIDISLECK